MKPPGTIRAWPPVLWEAECVKHLRLFHLGTLVFDGGDNTQPSAGQTMWGARSDNCEAGMAWDWVQILPGVVAMADPMSVITNLQLLGPEGEVLTAWEAARHLNEVVHALPWQQEVGRALSAP